MVRHCHCLLEPRDRARGPGTHWHVDVTAALTQDPHHLQEAPLHGHVQCCALGAVERVSPAPSMQEHSGGLRLVPGGRGSRKGAVPTGGTAGPTPARPGLTPEPRSAAPCWPRHPAGPCRPEPAAAAAPAPPGRGRQPPAGQSCPGSWCSPAGRASKSAPGSPPSLGLAGMGRSVGSRARLLRVPPH